MIFELTNLKEEVFMMSLKGGEGKEGILKDQDIDVIGICKKASTFTAPPPASIWNFHLWHKNL